jgi:hypothetical protein
MGGGFLFGEEMSGCGHDARIGRAIAFRYLFSRLRPLPASPASPEGAIAMIAGRLTTSLKVQHWTTIAIELAIVIIGVFIGTQVSNWNEARLERLQTQRMLDQLVPELDKQLAFFDFAKTYYGTSRAYAEQALAAWNDDSKITDEQFVIDAYQASEIYGIGIAQNWGLVFGGQQLRDIKDVKLREHLAIVLTSDYDVVGFNAVDTPYRRDVRQIIPNSIQDQIRAHCGDRVTKNPDTANLYVLPSTCPLKLDPGQAQATAAALRADRPLRGELNWHLATVATYLENAAGLQFQMLTLKTDLERRK